MFKLWSLARPYLTFEHPHYFRGTVVARWVSYTATVLWSVFTLMRLYQTGSTDPAVTFQAYRNLFGLSLPYFAFASSALGAVATFQMIRMALHMPPHRIGTVLNALISAFWIYNAVVIAFVLRPVLPLSSATSIVMALVSWCSFVSNPKPPGAKE